MTNKGKGSGIALILILIVVLIVVWLAVKNMSSLGIGGNSTHTESKQDSVQQAQDVVDQLNERIQNTGE